MPAVLFIKGCQIIIIIIIHEFQRDASLEQNFRMFRTFIF